MLNITKSITVNGVSTINGKQAAAFNATINSDNPEEISFGSWQIDKATYKANRAQARADEAAFEDYCYELQDEMIAEKAAETPEVEMSEDAE